MKITFWCEFPDQVNWLKAKKAIDFDTEIYVTCKSRTDYLVLKKRIETKHIKLGAWPILNKKEGYWYSGHTSKENIDKLDDFPGLRLKIDIEPPIYNGNYTNFKTIMWLVKWIINLGKNKDYLITKVNKLESEKIVNDYNNINKLLRILEIMADSLTMNINYELKNGEFAITGDINREGQVEILDSFLRGQLGAGKDESKPNVRDSYKISLQWFPENDRIVAFSDTGNKGLRDGILYEVLRKLAK
jgi:hypothetical protein